MSADSFVEPGGVAGAVALRAPVAPQLATSPAGRSWNGHERRSVERLRRLYRDFDVLCTSAVDAAEITAGLESAGFTDRTAQEHGYADVFELADALFHLTPRLVDQRPVKLANPWAERPLRHLARGVTFALPGVILVGALPRSSSTATTVALTVAMLFGWPAGQAMAFLGYALEGRRHPMAARAVLLLGFELATALAGAFALVARAAGVPVTVVGLGAGEIVYVAAAAVLLVLGAEAAVLAALVPGLAVAALGLAGVRLPAGAPLAGGVATVGLVSLAAVVSCRRVRPDDVRIAVRALSRHDAVEACYHVVYGVAGGALVTLPTLGGPATRASALALVPVIWSMGAAEWTVVRLRRRSFDLLNESISLRVFQRAVRRLAAGSAARYAAQLTLLTALLVAGLWWTGGAGPARSAAVTVGSAWLLGCGFYLALTLSSLGRMQAVAAAMASAAGLGLAAVLTVHQQAALLVAPLVLLAALVPPLRRTVGDPVRHM